MKRGIAVSGMLALVALAFVLVSGLAVAAEKGEMKMKTDVVKGELVDSRCYLGQGKRGPDHTKCAIACAKDGLPLGIVDAKGKYYTLVIQSSQIADVAGLDAEVEGMLKGDSIIPTKIKVNKDGTWTEVQLPKQMM
jgi:hypothetical protein